MESPSVWQAALLGIVQGVTEFLPISSSAHLILVPRLLGWSDQGLGFDIAVHGGTLVALVLVFREDLARAWRDLLDWRGGSTAPRPPLAAAPRLPWHLVVGTIPVAVAGLLLYDRLAGSARDPRLIAATLIGFGLLLGAVDRWASKSRPLGSLRWTDTLVVGFAQVLALVPGTSRSGVTMTAGMACGLDRPAAARFSFLLSIPATGLAFGKELLDIVTGQVPSAAVGPLAVGFLAAALSGYLVIRWLLAWVSRRSLGVFVAYRVLLGIALALGLAG